MELTINDLSKEYGRKKSCKSFQRKINKWCLWSTRGKWCGQDNFDANDLRCPKTENEKGAILKRENIHDLGEKNIVIS